MTATQDGYPASPRAGGRIGKVFALAALVAACVVTSACGERMTPEQQVRAVIAAGEDAAERRAHGDLMALVSPRFEGAYGEGPQEISRLLRGYLLAHPSVRVATRIEAIEFPYADLARVHLTVGTLGADVASLEFSADAQDVELELQLEDGEWRVTRAEWTSAFAR